LGMGRVENDEVNSCRAEKIRFVYSYT